MHESHLVKALTQRMLGKEFVAPALAVLFCIIANGAKAQEGICKTFNERSGLSGLGLSKRTRAFLQDSDLSLQKPDPSYGLSLYLDLQKDSDLGFFAGLGLDAGWL